MKQRGIVLSFVCAFAVLGTLPASPQAGSDPALRRLEAEIARLSRMIDGVVGVSATHLETGRRATLNGSERFPMASTYKIPIAVQLLTLVDEGKLQLDRMITLNPSDLHPGSGTLTDLFNKPGVSLSVRNLLELMMLISDNSATDVLLRLAGGPAEVTGRMRTLGIEGIRVDRPTALLLADYVGVAALPPESEWRPELFRSLFDAVGAEDRRAAGARYTEDPRDTAMPLGMNALLERIFRRDLLRKETADLLFDIMLRCRTGTARLKGILPEGTEVAHKTGTVGGSANDVGIIKLPQDSGHVAISVFVKGSSREVAARERAIAEIARAAHDFFLFLPEPASR